MNTPTPASRLTQRLARLLPYFGRPWSLWVTAALTTVLGALTEPSIPYLLKRLVDDGFGNHAIALWTVPAVLLSVFAIRGAAGFVAQMALAKVANNGIYRLRTSLFARLQNAEMSLFSAQSASALANTVVYEVQTGSAQLANALLSLAKDSLTVLALLGYLFYQNWRLTLIVMLLFPAVAWVMKTLSRRLYRVTKASQTATDQLAYVVEENVLAHRGIRLHGAQAQQSERFRGYSDALRRLAMKSTAASAAMTPLTQMLAAAALSAVVAIALWQSASAGSSIGSFVGFVTNMLMLLAPVKHLADVANPITRGLAAIERGLDLLDHTAAEASGTQRLPRARGQIQFDAVSLRYASDSAPALDHVSLNIAPGEVVAFVGPSGSGKTSLMNLLPRFVLPSAGTVALDDIALADWDLAALRQQLAMVSQDVVMLNDSVAANVALGQSPDRERVALCLQAANLADFVATLPQGMDTVVGHNATQLSGGQRQRLAIARALYKDAPVLILDEATSALDNESERLVQEALQRLMQQRTTLIVAHRLSTVENAHRIVVMVAGRIVEQGSHAALLAAGGTYARLYQSGLPADVEAPAAEPTLVSGSAE